ncbi:MAG TPA: hypothetical protein VGP22_16635, partial [Albitalea sp.]|nr:hypothetical protein [Albitalea sp.]
MRLPFAPTRIALWGLGAVMLAAAATLLFAPQVLPATVGRVAVGAVLAWLLIDMLRSGFAWRRAPLQWQRRLPSALAWGVPHTVACSLVNRSPHDWWIEIVDRADPALQVQGLPLEIYVPASSRIELHYTIVPRRRGLVRFAPADVQVRTLHGSLEWHRRIGERETLHVHPDFDAVARHVWLAKQRRLPEAGIRRPPEPLRGEGGHCVLFLIDCGQRMQSADGDFDASLNALLLLAQVALQEGDEVGAMTFGTDVRHRR